MCDADCTDMGRKKPSFCGNSKDCTWYFSNPKSKKELCEMAKTVRQSCEELLRSADSK
jgi:hypothetical protein